MDLFLGFLLGILASVIASFLFSWVSMLLPVERQRPIASVFRNPVLAIRLRSKGPHRDIWNLIRRLFRAWEDKSLDDYLACWTGDCVRVQGLESNRLEDRPAIAEKFQASSKKYIRIEVSGLVLEDLKLTIGEREAVVQVFYQFSLIRAADSLPTIESATEVYSLRKVNGLWRIAANIDHFRPIGSA